jgi:hypothetical protein
MISLDIHITLSHLTTLHVSVRQGQSGNQTKVTQYKTKCKHEKIFKIHKCTNIHKTEKQIGSCDNQYKAQGYHGNSRRT